MELKTTSIIDELNKIIAANDKRAMHELVINALYDALYKEQPFTDLDYLALGRARVVYQGADEAWLHANTPGTKINRQNRLSMNVGTIAARIERHAFTDPNLSLRDKFPKEFDRTSDFLATTHTAARHHPDPDVRAIAAWAEGHLGQRHAQQWGLTPQIG